jgi:FtsP/CotA-like multicopper oxidase with cupredoxin domain
MNVKSHLVRLVTVAVIALLALGAAAQTTNTISCIPTGQTKPSGNTLNPIPVLQSESGVLKGLFYTVSEQVRITQRPQGSNLGGPQVCYPQWVRAYRLTPPSSWNPPASQLGEPTPGPILRARVGEMINLTFVNVIDANKFQGVDDDKCDATSNYPITGPGTTPDTYPDCFNGSVRTNIHYHGTHTNPNTTGDNVFLEIWPSPRKTDGTNAPQITAASVQPTFDKFFAQCNAKLATNPAPVVFPALWRDLEAWPGLQEALLQPTKDFAPAAYEQDLKLIKDGKWPQYWAAAYPYCFKLPQFTGGWPPASKTEMQAVHTHGAGSSEVIEVEDPQRPLIMGQSPGTHWYHAHKHGSTTINVNGGMTGVFIIEGQYDDDINAFYGAGWTRKQPVLVINQLAGAPPLQSGQGGAGPGPDFSVNGQYQPNINVQGGQVQMWRIANTSSRSGVQLVPPPQGGLQWMQLAQDGVQFNNVNYKGSLNTVPILYSGNRVDLLVKAPAYNSAQGANNTYKVMVYNTIDSTDKPPQSTTKNPTNGVLLLTVTVTGAGTPMQFMPNAPTFPAFLADITPDEVTGTQSLLYASSPNPSSGVRANPSQHTIGGKKFDGSVGASVTLNQVQEWKIVNATYPPAANNQISHPFHIHINPFQIFEFFDPNQVLTTQAGAGTVTVAPSGNNLATCPDLLPKPPTPWLIATGIVTGTGTNFQTDFRVGDFIWITSTDASKPGGTQPAIVISIDSPTQMTTNSEATISTASPYTIAIPLYTANAGQARKGQCVLNPSDKTSWKPCNNMVPQTNAIWWDVFPIPSGNTFYSTNGTATCIPGYFKMRSRFVDYPGDFVSHCHILAHEDRGMMTVIRVIPLQAPVSHH